MNHPSVCIVIVNWNQKGLTEECLKSLKNITYARAKTVVVDNGSTDGSIEYLRERYPEIKYISNAENLGFSGGNNVGIEYAVAEGFDYIYLLNNDTEVDSNFLTDIITATQKDPKIGIAGSTVFYFSSPDTVWYAGGHANWISGDMLDPRVGKQLTVDELPLEDVDEVAGAGMLIKRQVIEDVGVLDPSFFIYFEETDWCQRAKKYGWRVVWVPESKVWHKVSMTFGELSPVMIYLMTRNRWLFMWKHSPYFILFMAHYFLRSAKNYLVFWRQKQPKLQRALVWGVRDALLGRYGKGEMESLRGKAN